MGKIKDKAVVLMLIDKYHYKYFWQVRSIFYKKPELSYLQNDSVFIGKIKTMLLNRRSGLNLST